MSQEPTRAAAGQRRFWLILLLCTGLFAWLSTCFLTVTESEHVIIERFGRLTHVYDQPQQRGLHVKWPWPIEIARRFDRRMQLFDPPGRELLTRDRKNITVDVWVCWRIADGQSAGVMTSPADTVVNSAEQPVVQFYRKLGTAAVTETRLDSRLRSVLSAEIGQLELSDLLRVELADDANVVGRESTWEWLAEKVRAGLADVPGNGETSARHPWGIEIVEVGIKRINFPEGNRRAVYERMKSERLKIAEGYRSAGVAEAKVIEAAADLGATTVLAKARADADRIRSQADARALAVLNKAHAADPRLYEVLRTLETYQQIFSPKTTLVLSTSSKLFQLLTEGIPETQPPVSAEPESLP